MKNIKFMSFFMLAALAHASQSPSDLMQSNVLSKNVQSSLAELINENRITSSDQWSDDAVEKMQALRTATVDQLLHIRKHSELSIAEIQNDLHMSIPRDHQARPATLPDGALYMDVYQESPVLINYKYD